MNHCAKERVGQSQRVRLDGAHGRAEGLHSIMHGNIIHDIEAWSRAFPSLLHSSHIFCDRLRCYEPCANP